MFRTIDDFLIDRVYQQIVNRTYLHPLDLSLHFNIIAFVTFAGPTVWDLLGYPTGIAICFAALILFWLTTMWLSARNNERLKTYLAQGARNPARITGYIQRMILISLTVLVFPMNFIVGDIRSALSQFGFFCLMNAAYFSACDLPPPKPKRLPIGSLAEHSPTG